MSAVVRESDLPTYLGYPERTCANVKRRPDFPKPRDLTGTGKRRIWLRSELDSWLSALPPAERLPEPPQLRAARLARAQPEPT